MELGVPEGAAFAGKVNFARKKGSNRLTGLSMALLGAVLWGVSGTAAQVLFHRYHFSAGWLVMVRMTASGILLLLGASVQFGFRHTFLIWKSKGDVVGLLAFAVMGLLGVQYSYFASILHGNAAMATLLQYLGPVFISVYLAFRSRRLPGRFDTMAVLLAIVGTACLVTDGHWRGLTVPPVAIVWGLVSAITAAFYTVYPIRLLHRYGSGTVMGWGMLLGGVGMGLKTPPWDFTGIITLHSVLLVCFVVLFGTLIGFYLYLSSLKRISPSEAALVASGEPLSAAVVAMMLLHVRMGSVAWLGGACILLTVTLLPMRKSSNDEG